MGDREKERGEEDMARERKRGKLCEREGGKGVGEGCVVEIERDKYNNISFPHSSRKTAMNQSNRRTVRRYLMRVLPLKKRTTWFIASGLIELSFILTNTYGGHCSRL